MTSREHDRNAPYEKNKYLSFLKYICIYLFIYTFSYIIIPSDLYWMLGPKESWKNHFNAPNIPKL